MLSWWLRSLKIYSTWWGPRKVNSIIPVWIWRYENQYNWWYKFQSESKAREDQCPSLVTTKEQVVSHKHFVSVSLLTNWLRPITLAEKATHSSTLVWKIPWVEEPGRLQSMGSSRVGHDWVTWLSFFTFMHWRRKWQKHMRIGCFLYEYECLLTVRYCVENWPPFPDLVRYNLYVTLCNFKVYNVMIWHTFIAK